jgi:spore coat polysaccharide biosynthesis predicted glycosyltransferase SpsG
LDAILAVGEDSVGLAYAAEAPASLEVLPPSPENGPKPLLDVETLLASCDVARYDIVVVDMLDTPAESLDNIKRLGPCVITMDDRGPGRFGADAIIDFLVREPDYSQLPASVRLYEGPEYATLDATYAEPVPPRTVAEPPLNALVSVGGADAAGISLKVARALLDVEGIAEVELVCGRAYRYVEQLRDILRFTRWNTRLSVGLPSLKPAFLRSDLAIVAGGMTMHEACCTGTPALAVCQPIDHQLELALWFEQAKAMRFLGDGSTVSVGEISEAVAVLVRDVGARQDMSRMAPRLVDGRGTERTARAILETVARRHGR